MTTAAAPPRGWDPASARPGRGWGRLSPQLRGRPARAWVVDVLVLLAAAYWWASTQVVDQEFFAQMPGWWVRLDLVAGVVAGLSLWWRHRYPEVLVLALAVLGGLFITAGLAALVSVYVVASRRRMSVAVLATGVHLAIAIPYYLLFPVFPVGLAVWAVVMLSIYVAVLSLGLAVRSRRAVIENLVSQADRERAEFQQRLQHSRRLEREQIAREMHDVLAHRISLLSVHAGALEFRARPGAEAGRRLSDADLREATTVIRESAHRALEELHEVLTVLREDGTGTDGTGTDGTGTDGTGTDGTGTDGTGTDRPAGGVAAGDGLAGEVLGTARPAVGIADLEDLVAEVVAAGQQVDLRLLPGREALRAWHPKLQRTAYRVVQEGLTNARKHTPGSRVRVHLDGSDGDRLVVRVSNPLPVGTTGSEIPGAGSGLTGLAERVRIDGGRLSHHAEDGSFVLRAELPWRG